MLKNNLTVGVAQRLEHQAVVLGAEGSRPFTHPNSLHDCHVPIERDNHIEKRPRRLIIHRKILLPGKTLHGNPGKLIYF
jgi:hypothetical protein